MAEEELTFSLVGIKHPGTRQDPPRAEGADDPAPEAPFFEPTEPVEPTDPVDQALGTATPARRAGRDPYGREKFPLAGPILEKAQHRELRGKCSQCESRLRLKVGNQATVTVRCPICGHTRTVDL
ncbi:MAG: hypothetical protein R3185_03725 [Candidatus Thermoplasmatota archaeon]|nr:hypothetical protein [Candidatus Thermoplasmatota archaeon]